VVADEARDPMAIGLASPDAVVSRSHRAFHELAKRKRGDNRCCWRLRASMAGSPAHSIPNRHGSAVGCVGREFCVISPWRGVAWRGDPRSRRSRGREGPGRAERSEHGRS
jgi:hypothetical protein